LSFPNQRFYFSTFTYRHNVALEIPSIVQISATEVSLSA
jgi:hypothetical protein